MNAVDILLRAADLFRAIVNYAVSSSDSTDGMKAVVNGLGQDLLSPFISILEQDRDVSSYFAVSLGVLLGARRMSRACEDSGLDGKRAQQTVDFQTTMVHLLDRISHECMHHPDSEQIADASDEERGRQHHAEPRLHLTANGGTDAALNASLGYIPTVSGIVSQMSLGNSVVTSASDEQLGRFLSGLSAALSLHDNRVRFCKIALPDGGPTGPAALTMLLDRDVSLPVQATYQCVFCLWLLSFPKTCADESSAAEIATAMEEAAVPRLLTSVLREVHAEKVVRISLATLRNLMQLSTVLRKEMVGAGLIAALESLCFRRWNDEDICEDLRVLADALESELTSMTTFDVYRHEILSGALEWTPVHRDDNFWRENVEKLDSNNLEVLRCMVRLLNESSDTTVLSVACHDLAQFVKYHPRGRFIAHSLGVKGRLMELMTNGDVDVRRYALNTVQVLMISNWNLMQRVS